MTLDLLVDNVSEFVELRLPLRVPDEIKRKKEQVQLPEIALPGREGRVNAGYSVLDAGDYTLAGYQGNKGYVVMDI